MEPGIDRGTILTHLSIQAHMLQYEIDNAYAQVRNNESWIRLPLQSSSAASNAARTLADAAGYLERAQAYETALAMLAGLAKALGFDWEKEVLEK